MNSWQHKLTPLQATRMVLDRSRGMTIRQLAAKYDLNEDTVIKYLKGGHVERRLKPCGTNAAYMRHIRRGEKPCPSCCAAHAGEIKRYQDAARAARTS